MTYHASITNSSIIDAAVRKEQARKSSLHAPQPQVAQPRQLGYFGSPEVNQIMRQPPSSDIIAMMNSRTFHIVDEESAQS
jgi:hypothetical protein